MIPAPSCAAPDVGPPAKVAISSAVETVAALIVAKVAELGGRASFEPKTRVISIAPTFRVTIGWARYVREKTRPHRWVARVNRRVGSDLTLIVRMDTANVNILDYYLIATDEIAEDRVGRGPGSANRDAGACIPRNDVAG